MAWEELFISKLLRVTQINECKVFHFLTSIVQNKSAEVMMAYVFSGSRLDFISLIELDVESTRLAIVND